MVSHVSITPEEILIQHQSHSERCQKIKSEGDDLTQISLMTGQKLVIFVGVAALMWFHKLASEQDEYEGMQKRESI